jgi:hypothetical protein
MIPEPSLAFQNCGAGGESDLRFLQKKKSFGEARAA